MSKELILGLFTELLGSGGVQRIGRHTAAVLSSVAAEWSWDYRILSLNDPPGRHMLRVGSYQFTFQGFGRRKVQFTMAALNAAFRTHLAYLGHPNFAPLGLIAQTLNPRLHYWVATYGIEVWSPLPLIRRLGLRSAYGITTISKFTASQIVEKQKINRTKIALIPPALEPDFLNKGTPSKLLEQLPGKILLTVTRLAATEKLKGVDTVIHAMPTILRDVPDVYYYVVGDGDDRARLETLVAELGIQSCVRFVGKKKDDELKTYYQESDVFVMPSRKEGFGIVFLEAMAFGKPVIGGNYGGTPDIIVDGETGFLVEYGDVDALADRLIRLLQDEKLRKRMGEAARRHVEENYTFEHFRKRLLELFTKDGRGTL